MVYHTIGRKLVMDCGIGLAARSMKSRGGDFMLYCFSTFGRIKPHDVPTIQAGGSNPDVSDRRPN